MHIVRNPLFRILGVLLVVAVSAGGSSSSAAPSSATRTFKNPVYKHNFPDPFVLKVGKTYYAYGTNTATAVTPTLISTDLVHWKAGPDAMPLTPRWVASDVWAPQVFQASKKKFVMWFAAKYQAASHQCVGFSISSSPLGPFKSSATKPTICQSSLGGDIDPDIFRDTNGSTYVLWKNDGNCCGDMVYLWSQKASSDATKLAGKPKSIDQFQSPWEGNLIEAPFMWKHGTSYYLFYSANGYASYNYSVGYAVCKTPLGPCKDAPENPILKSACKAAGPGGETIIADAKGQTWMLYHAWPSGSVGDDTVGRWLWIDRLDWKNGKPVVHGPTCSAQPAPAT